MANEIIDKIINFTISKKLSVFILGTIFLFNDKIESTQWIQLAMFYIGTQGAIDFIKTIKNN